MTSLRALCMQAWQFCTCMQSWGAGIHFMGMVRHGRHGLPRPHSSRSRLSRHPQEPLGERNPGAGRHAGARAGARGVCVLGRSSTRSQRQPMLLQPALMCCELAARRCRVWPIRFCQGQLLVLALHLLAPSPCNADGVGTELRWCAAPCALHPAHVRTLARLAVA